MKASFTASPSRLKENIKTARVQTGKSNRWGSLRSTEMLPFSKIITPRLGVGG